MNFIRNEKSVKKSLTTNYRKALCNFVYMPGIHATFVNYSSFLYTVEPPISDQPKCKGFVVAYGRWSLTYNVQE